MCIPEKNVSPYFLYHGSVNPIDLMKAIDIFYKNEVNMIVNVRQNRDEIDDNL